MTAHFSDLVQVLQ